MRRLLFSTSAIAALMLAAPAFADCTEELRSYNESVTAQDDYRAAMTPAMRNEVRQLRDSAYILQQAGQEEACQSVVSAIKEITENPRETAEQMASVEDWNSAEIERLKNAKNLDQVAGQLRAEEIIGSDIRNMENQDLGEIEDVLLATKEGESSFAIISHGGFIGLGEKQIAVPMQQLMVTEDKDIFVLDVSEERLESAPSFERDKFDTLTDDSWRQTNEEFFGIEKGS